MQRFGLARLAEAVAKWSIRFCFCMPRSLVGTALAVAEPSKSRTMSSLFFYKLLSWRRRRAPGAGPSLLNWLFQSVAPLWSDRGLATVMGSYNTCRALGPIPRRELKPRRR